MSTALTVFAARTAAMQPSAGSRQCPAFAARDSVLSTQYLVLGTQYSVLSTQNSVLSAQCPVHGARRWLATACRIFVLTAVLAAVWFASEGALAQTATNDARHASDGGGRQNLFDGRDLGKWQAVDAYDFRRHGKVDVRDGMIVMEKGAPATGIKWAGPPLPKTDYELTFEGKRVEGDDFFCSVTFPVGDKALTLVVGGWNGQVVGLSSIDGEAAVENETCVYKEFERNRWYRVRVSVTAAKIEAWIDDEKLVDLACEDRKFTIYWSMEPMLPLGIATWDTTGAVRNICLQVRGERREQKEEGKSQKSK